MGRFGLFLMMLFFLHAFLNLQKNLLVSGLKQEEVEEKGKMEGAIFRKMMRFGGERIVRRHAFHGGHGGAGGHHSSARGTGAHGRPHRSGSNSCSSNLMHLTALAFLPLATSFLILSFMLNLKK
ncbi:hypothetical protein CK203_060055 [Vitis vinifera]|uniref:Uncharacterized protein n=1 Tax=Vitis vinifera TaxID=29760 RepID=A0A438GK24_VITVI|nr:hypothetical protein CK203_060055 [Vitis vinifera]